MAEKKQVGKVTHFFSKISVAAVELTGALKVGDMISIEGGAGAIEQRVESMQMNNQPITEAKAGDVVGLKVLGKVKEGDRVYLGQ
ncbi:MAG: hypothetical protein ACUVXD_11830 [Thermodesulfobacteriota bacterium]